MEKMEKQLSSLGDIYDNEQAILCCIFNNPDLFHIVNQQLTINDWSHPSYKIVYRAMIYLDKKNMGIDIINIGSVINIKTKGLNAIGGRVFLINIMEDYASEANMDNYIKNIIEHNRKKKIVDLASVIEHNVNSDDCNSTEILSEASHYIESIKSYKQTINSCKDNALGIYENIVDMSNNNINDIIINSQYKALDRITGGFMAGNMSIIAARPANGKTALAINMARNMAKNGKCVGILSLEMSFDEIIHRMIGIETQIDTNKIRTGRLEDEEITIIAQSLDKISKYNIYIDDTSFMNIDTIINSIKNMKHQHKIEVLFIDYIQLINHNKNEFDAITQHSRKIKQIAKELNIVIICLAQLNRASLTKSEPDMSDLKGSGSLEQDADHVMIISPDDMDNKYFKLLIDKNRHGETGYIQYHYNKKTQAIFESNI